MSDFKWRHFAGDIILQCVRWYCKYGISYRELEEMMEERGICVDHTTLYRWVQTYAPEIEKRLRSGLSHMALALERGRCGGGDIAGVSVFDPALRPPYGRIRRLLCRNRGPTTEQCPPRST